MKILLAFVSVLIAVSAVSNKQQRKRSACAENYEKSGTLREDQARHTMCMHSKTSDYGRVNDTEIQIILDKHNELRKDPKTTQTAAAMCLMYYDPEIAKIAQHYADSCPWGHDKNRDVPGYNIYTGQNIAMYWGGTGSWAQAVQGWFDEVKDFQFGHGSVNGEKVGHYTQVVKDTSCRIGCGFAMCQGTKHYVCNYATGQADFSNPFVTGTPCSGCDGYCVDEALCDTGGHMCYHGEMDFTTMECKCDKGYTGLSCEILECDGTQKIGCWNFYTEYDCLGKPDILRDCPIKCGRCTQNKEAGEKWIPAPAADLIGGSLGSPWSLPGGSVEDVYTPDGVPTLEEVCAQEDRDFCNNKVSWDDCQEGEKFKLTYNGEEGTPFSFCPHKCGVC